MQLANVVGLVTCTVCDAPGAMLPNAQLSVFAAIEQPWTAGLIDQLTPAPVGNGSSSVTPVAVPAPVLFTLIVKPIDSPAFTVALSAVFVIWRPGHWTDVVADASTFGLFVACALAVFG